MPYPDNLGTSSNVVEFTGHVYQGNTFRSPRGHIQGSPVLIGQIRSRHEVFCEDENPA